jgi:transcriptional regulator with XRE-family HTH domain
MRKKKVGNELRQLREHKGMGIKTASKELGVSYAYLSRVENEHRTPSPALVKKLSMLYGVETEELLAKLHHLPPDILHILEVHGKDVFDSIRKLYSETRKAPRTR